MKKGNKPTNFKPKLAAHEITGASVQVRGDDVNGALRRLKKILEGADRQKDLSKHEYYEKPSVKNKRSREAAVKRTQRESRKEMISGESPYKKPDNLKWMKGKRKRRKVMDAEAMASLAAKRRS